MNLTGKNFLITGGARRLGREFSLAISRAGGTVIIHHGHSPQDAQQTRETIESSGGKAHIIQADFSDPTRAIETIEQALQFGDLDGLVNNAAIFEPIGWKDTDLSAWNRHLDINLAAPFFASQAFAKAIHPGQPGRIVNILDWRALRPGADHFPYTISKAALAALTRSLAVALAPGITVNGLALGAILSPSDGATPEGILKYVPAGRWAELSEVSRALLFFLEGPAYVTGEILHVDGGRHLI